MTTALTVATHRAALEAAHGDIAAWVKGKREEVATEIGEATEHLEIAKARKWATRAPALALKRLADYDTFLAKIAGAIEAGYAVVPNFDMDLLAVRTEATEPGQGESESRSAFTVGATRLPVGRGEYVSPEPELESWTRKDKRPDGSTREVTVYRATALAPVAVPLVLMQRELADALGRAMREKFFDEIGIVSDHSRRDPVLVGRIRHPKATRWGPRGISFFIGWWFDLRALAL